MISFRLPSTMIVILYTYHSCVKNTSPRWFRQWKVPYQTKRGKTCTQTEKAMYLATRTSQTVWKTIYNIFAMQYMRYLIIYDNNAIYLANLTNQTMWKIICNIFAMRFMWPRRCKYYYAINLPHNYLAIIWQICKKLVAQISTSALAMRINK